MAWPASNPTQQLNDDVEQLFAPGIEDSAAASVQTPATGPALAPAIPQSYSSGALNTLDESIWATVQRDLLRIAKNLFMVVFPFQDRSQQNTALRNWDLWGPMLFTLSLAVTLSIRPSAAKDASKVFSMVFAVVTIGAILLTLNVVLLGGNIGFFQAVCLLGYCIFPMTVASIITAFVHNMIARWIIISVALVWSSWACVPFIAGSVGANRKALAVYPVALLYTSIAWLALVL